MDADAIGGAVNLVSKKAPDLTYFSLEAAGGYAPIREDLSGGGSATYGTRFADGRFGMLLSAPTTSGTPARTTRSRSTTSATQASRTTRSPA